MSAIRVLHCPDAVAGNAPQLAAAERSLGLASWSVALEETPYGYRPDEILFAAGDGATRREFKRLRLLRRALRDFDVVHFNFGQSMLPSRPGAWSGSAHQRAHQAYARIVAGRDLPLLRRAGKGIVVTYQGDDARQGDWVLANFELATAQETEPGYYTPASDEERRRRICHVDKNADAIFALNPDLLHVLPERAEFLPYSSVDIQAWNPVPPRAAGPPVVVHAPTDRGGKGTRFVLAAVEALRAEGVELEFVLVEGLTRAQARAEYERADLVVDQLLAGWYGGLAVEAMALGKPVIAYLRHSDFDGVPQELVEQLPVIEARPDTITDVLRRLLTSERSRLPEIGAAGRAFVERWHDPVRVAERLKQTYERIVAR